MRIGWNGGGHHSSLDVIRAQAKRAVADGFASFWLSQITGLDALTALAAVAVDAPGIELGVSIVPVYGRHPIPLAAQVLTTQAATGGRLVLGIGASHQMLVEGMLGEPYTRPFTRTKPPRAPDVRPRGSSPASQYVLPTRPSARGRLQPSSSRCTGSCPHIGQRLRAKVSTVRKSSWRPERSTRCGSGSRRTSRPARLIFA